MIKKDKTLKKEKNLQGFRHIFSARRTDPDRFAEKRNEDKGTLHG